MIEDVLGLLSSTLVAMVPLLLASVGEIIAERSGVVNIGLEGIFVLSAFLSALTAFYTRDPYVALAVGLLVGFLSGVLHGVISVYLRGDQIISGVGFNMFAYGISIIGLICTWGQHGASPIVAKMPFIGGGFLFFSPLLILSIIIAIVVWYWLFRTSSGLKLRACGEDPRSAEAMGVNVLRTRFYATLIGAMLTGLGGAYMVVGWIGQFTRYISAGRGFIALAIVAFSGWNPIIAIAGSMIFGFFDALSLYLPVKIQLIYPRMNLTSTSYVFRTVPYIAVLITVSVAFRKGRMPRDLGRPYIKE
ncbi:MAG: ABC transporter permease [Thermoproteota archaeon]|uniref:ABC transporter permease n=1 Tax=Candidatus Methanodesulfokora washburnensis TaxID=2478471 RepID=A0A429GLL8_9CREN|nr:ABC transporter permease [Candidatus Methanodesulfokores washburnensis]RSN74663.1 ABC transporter permease [Candidatus Methanodesulfokores washburnensis]TDA41541.1 MAG: ABC transporter permease [Candidatus Korarchaeota archaeon]